MQRPRPVLFLDVDGPLIPFGASVAELPQGYTTHVQWRELPRNANPLLVRLDPGLGPQLQALDCDLVWATTWMHEANEAVAPLLSLPPLAVVEWPEPDEDDEVEVRRGLHWKTRALVSWASGRDFAWLDDEISEIDQRHVAEKHAGAALLVKVSAAQGLRSEHFDRVREWRAQL